MAAHRCEELESRLRNSRLSSVSDRQDFAAWLDSLTEVESCIAAGLRRASETADWLMFDLYVLAASHHPADLYTAVLCEVLGRQSEDVNNEDIVDVLAKIGDPAAVGCLADAMWWEPPWDEYRNLGVKAVWALADIGTPEALAVLRDAVSCEASEIREMAAHKLKLAGA